MHRVAHKVLSLLALGLVAWGMPTSASGQSTGQPAKKAAANTDQMAAQFQARMMAWFKKCDINNDGNLDNAEIGNSLGTGARASDFRKKDVDGDKMVSREEFESWVVEYAPRYVEEVLKEQQEQEAELKKLQAAAAKANQQAKQRYDQMIRQQRDRIARDRRDDQIENRIRQRLQQQQRRR